MKKIYGISGFTLVELLVTVSITVILIAVAVPSFKDLVLKRKISSELRDLKLDLVLARSEAITRNTFVGVCSSNDASYCQADSDWSEGWILFEDDGEGGGTPKDGVRNGSESLVRAYQSGDGPVSITAYDVNDVGVNGLAFNARGYLGLIEPSLELLSPDRLTFRFCPGSDEMFARGVIIALTGRVVDSSDSDSDGIYEDAESINFDCPEI